MQRYHAKQREKAAVVSVHSDRRAVEKPIKLNEDLWRRLDALERQEEEKGELNR